MVCASLRRRAEAADGGAQRGQLDGNLLDLRRAGCAGKGRVRARIEQQEPGARVAAEDRFNPLAIEPARGFDGFRAAECGNVRIDEAAQAMRHAGGNARKARSAGSEDDGGLGGAAEGFDRRRRPWRSAAGRRLRRRRPAGARQWTATASGCGCGVGGHNADGERG